MSVELMSVGVQYGLFAFQKRMRNCHSRRPSTIALRVGEDVLLLAGWPWVRGSL